MDLNTLNINNQPSITMLHFGDALKKITDVWERPKPFKLIPNKWLKFMVDTIINKILLEISTKNRSMNRQKSPNKMLKSLNNLRQYNL